MVAEARFSRTDTPEGARFDVVPADDPMPFIAGASVAIIMLVAGGVLGLVVIFLLVRLSQGAFIRGLVPAAIFGVPAIWLLLVIRRGLGARKAIKRHPVTIVANREGLTVEGAHYPAADIVELSIRHPNDKGGSMGMTISVQEPSMAQAGYNVGRNARIVSENRSLSLFLRTKASSVPISLVGGLTPLAGEALRNDLLIAMQP